MTANRICSLFGIRYPLVQAGMVWCSPWQLAAAVSNAGGLGVIGAASMHPETLAEHIRKCREATGRPFGVNLPLLYPDIAAQIAVILSADVPVVFTSAGNPAAHTAGFKAAGRKVVHVVSSVRFARKAEAAGVDAVVAEGFEAGGHNGREETTTLCLVPQVVRSVSLPVLAAGGIATGRAMLAAMALGAEGVQIGMCGAAQTPGVSNLLLERALAHSTDNAPLREVRIGMTRPRTMSGGSVQTFFETVQDRVVIARPSGTLRSVPAGRLQHLFNFDGQPCVATAANLLDTVAASECLE
ncbi:MAG: nitronate monooxygenase, partial [Desulfobacterales bacterium]